VKTDIRHPKQTSDAYPVHRWNYDTQTLEFWDSGQACWKPDLVCGLKTRFVASRYPVATYASTFAEPTL